MSDYGNWIDPRFGLEKYLVRDQYEEADEQQQIEILYWLCELDERWFAHKLVLSLDYPGRRHRLYLLWNTDGVQPVTEWESERNRVYDRFINEDGEYTAELLVSFIKELRPRRLFEVLRVIEEDNPWLAHDIVDDGGIPTDRLRRFWHPETITQPHELKLLANVSGT